MGGESLMARTKRGFGSTERRTNRATGKTTGWRARYLAPDGVRYHRTFTARVDAEAWLYAEEGLIARGDWVPPNQRYAASVSMPVFEYARVNLDSRNLAPRTREEYENYVTRFVEAHKLGAMPIRAVAPMDIGAWLADVRSQTGPTMSARVYSLVASIFNAAVRDRLVDRSPCTVRGASNAPRVSAKTSAAPEEVAAVLEHLGERYRALVLVAAWSGLRSGEIRNLRRRHVDLDVGTVSVEQQVQNIRGQGKVVRDVKTEAGRRTVNLPSAVTEVLARHIATFSQPGPDGLVFPSRVGTPISQSVLWSVWNKARQKIGRPDLRIHDLRATAATMAARTGATIAELQARLGHATPGVAMRYQTAAQAQDARIAAALDDYVVLPEETLGHRGAGAANADPRRPGPAA
ncbi:tyrosine-type recombinase/integrase [Isoptericola sp. NPDC056618]|uniref:tyrosine-type recombinase/integrase n=1 Tax=Isoptericola sp. NPDC056618 TaxID=3345878 RepID=UPI0036902433